MTMVKVATLRGVLVNGEHVDAHEIISVDNKVAGVLVGGQKAVFVVDEKQAEAELKKRRKASQQHQAEMAKSTRRQAAPGGPASDAPAGDDAPGQ